MTKLDDFDCVKPFSFCPFIKDCEVHSEGRCGHLGLSQKEPYRCNTAISFNVRHKDEGNDLPRRHD